MATGKNTYGSTAEVAALCPLYTISGTFTTTTRPTLTQVERFLERVSAIVNVLLAEQGFAIPVTQPDAELAIDDFVIQETAWLAEYANGAGPFVPQAGEMRTPSPSRLIVKDAESFIVEHADGIAALGATRTYDMTYGLACRTEDADGNELYPPFSRDQVGHTIPEWDEE